MSCEFCARTVPLLGYVTMCSMRCCLLLPMFRGLSVCLLVTTVSCVKTAEPVEVSFDIWTQVDQRNHVLGGAQIPQGKGQFLVHWMRPGRLFMNAGAQSVLCNY